MNRMRFERGIALLLPLMLMLLWAVPSLAEYSFSRDVDAIENAVRSVFMLEVYDQRGEKTATGSGFVAFAPDILITNYHVVSDAAYVIAIGDDTRQHVLNRICALDEKNDIALLAFAEDPQITPLEVDTDSPLKRSHTVVAIGSPAGLMNTVSIGNISAFYTRDDKDWIQFTAPISSGSSGGALLNDQGKVIGITTATYTSTQNINMAVKVQYALDLYNRWNRADTRAVNQNTLKTGMLQRTASGSMSEDEVWRTASGSKYHSSPSCSNMRSPQKVRLTEALEAGLEPCGKCYR